MLLLETFNYHHDLTLCVLNINYFFTLLTQSIPRFLEYMTQSFLPQVKTSNPFTKIGHCISVQMEYTCCGCNFTRNPCGMLRALTWIPLINIL